MLYQLLPLGKVWEQGMIALPKVVATDYLKFTSEYQLKALLIIIAQNGRADSRNISKALGCTESDAKDFLEFWVEEGVLACNGQVVEPVATVHSDNAESEKPVKEKKVKKEAMPLPVLTPKDIVSMCRDNEELTLTLRHAQEVLGKSLSHIEQELIVNMVTYYGLPCDIVLTILQFYKTEKAKGNAIGTGYIAAMAKNWCEEGIVTLDAAEDKLRSLEKSDKLWREITAVSGLRHRNPTIKQREMITKWSEDFSFDMIAMACEIMREHTEKPTLKYVDGVLKNWKKNGISTPEDVENEQKKHERDAQSKDNTDIDKTYDIDDINRRAMLNDNYNI